jgi:hypothetical protein
MVTFVPSIFHTREVHVDEMNTRNNIESLEKNLNQKPLWRQRFEIYNKYFISKGNPSSTIGDKNIIVAIST